MANFRVSNEDLLKFQSDRSASSRCSSCSGSLVFSIVLFTITYTSPIAFLVVPKIFGGKTNSDIPGFNASFTPPIQELTDIGTNKNLLVEILSCQKIFTVKPSQKCLGSQGELIAIAVKLLILLGASWIFLSSKTRIARLPSINLYRFILSTVSFATVTIFWLFYAFKGKILKVSFPTYWFLFFNISIWDSQKTNFYLKKLNFQIS